MEENIHTEEGLRNLLDKAIDYYLKGIQDGINLTRRQFEEKDTYQKKFNLVMQFINDVGCTKNSLEIR